MPYLYYNIGKFFIKYIYVSYFHITSNFDIEYISLIVNFEVLSMKLKEGFLVTRKSYGEDIIFYIDRIIRLKDSTEIAILKGTTVRIEADARLEDLRIADISKLKKAEEKLERILLNTWEKYRKENRNCIMQKGIILHLDGDRRYCIKSSRCYKKMGLNAIVRNISENRQAIYVRSLLEKYTPDILVITGHDAMLKKGSNYDNLYNYRNSRHFINTVIEARKWEKSSDKLVIFAGACQSYYEAIIGAGADFASSPGRILIDFTGPLIVAQKIALTENYRFITAGEISAEVREGKRGISGIGAKGKMRKIKVRE